MRKEKVSLDDFVRQEFRGPVRLRCQTMKADVPGARKFVPADNNERGIIEEMFDLENHLPWFFPVAAFSPQVGKVYPCCLRLRGTIIEVIPENRTRLQQSMEWQPDPQPSPTMEFKRDNRGHWIARHPKTGQYIQAFEMELEAGPDGKAVISPGQLSIRPAMTRTFWIAGDPEKVKQATVMALDMYHEVEAPCVGPGAQAPQFFILDGYFTAFEAMGVPIGKGVVEISSFHADAVAHARSFEKWTHRRLLALLHPDRLNEYSLAPERRAEVEGMSARTGKVIREMTAWFTRWAEEAQADLRLQRTAGLALQLSIPPPAGRKPRPGPALMEKPDAEVEAWVRSVITGRKPEKTRRRKLPAKKTARPAGDKQKPAHEENKKTMPTTTTSAPRRPETVQVASSGEAPQNHIGARAKMDPATRATMEAMAAAAAPQKVGNDGKVRRKCPCGRIFRIGPNNPTLLCPTCRGKK